MNSMTKHLARELCNHELRIYRQELKVKSEQAKLEVMNDFNARWREQLTKLEEQEQQTKTQKSSNA